MSLTRSWLVMVVGAAVVVSGCGGSRRREPAPAVAPPIADTTALWKLAPSGTLGALVAGPGSLATLRDGLRLVTAAMTRHGGDAAQAATGIRARVRHTALGVDLWDEAAIRRAGLDLSRGIAWFVTSAGTVIVLPATRIDGDAAATLAGYGLTHCKQVAGLHACATTAALIAEVGRGDGMAREIAAWPASLRGDVEIYGAPQTLPGAAAASAVSLRVGLVLERGGIVVRAAMPAQLLGGLRLAADPAAPSRLLAGSGAPHASGVATFRLPPDLIAPLAAFVPDLPLGGTSAHPLLGSLTGEIAAYALPGLPARGAIKLALSDDAPANALVRGCSARLPMVSLRKDGKRCRFELALPATWPRVGGELAVLDRALVVTIGDGAAPSGKPDPAPLRDEILSRSWLFAVWGSGSALAEWSQVAAGQALPPDARLAVAGLFHLSEVAVAARIDGDTLHGLARVRTVWSNPEPVMRELAPLIERAASGQNVSADAAALARRFPDSPLASDLRAGMTGMFAPVTMIGITSAIAIPAFVKYTRKSKSSEPREALRTLTTRALDRYYAASDDNKARFPAPSAGPVPPVGSCCAGPDYACAPDPALWQSPPWTELSFAMTEPHRYSYQYEVAKDGKSFTVSAFGDLDCDGHYSTFRATQDASSKPLHIDETDPLE